MTDAGWAERVARKVQLRIPGHGPEPLVQVTTVATLLKAEHARSVRIVKREIKRLTASIKDDKRGKNDDAAAIHVYALSICNTLLGKLQRGRGGKG